MQIVKPRKGTVTSGVNQCIDFSSHLFHELIHLFQNVGPAVARHRDRRRLKRERTIVKGNLDPPDYLTASCSIIPHYNPTGHKNHSLGCLATEQKGKPYDVPVATILSTHVARQDKTRVGLYRNKLQNSKPLRTLSHLVDYRETSGGLAWCDSVDTRAPAVYLIGTAHVSKQSSADVLALINAEGRAGQTTRWLDVKLRTEALTAKLTNRDGTTALGVWQVKPDCVVLELCKSRVGLLAMRKTEVRPRRPSPQVSSNRYPHQVCDGTTGLCDSVCTLRHDALADIADIGLSTGYIFTRHHDILAPHRCPQ
eukprot:499355-Prorocentrum_minimum.AAC.2